LCIALEARIVNVVMGYWPDVQRLAGQLLAEKMLLFSTKYRLVLGLNQDSYMKSNRDSFLVGKITKA
jgi:hypothetical protein